MLDKNNITESQADPDRLDSRPYGAQTCFLESPGSGSGWAVARALPKECSGTAPIRAEERTWVS